MRLPIDTFLNLTTESSQEINKIKEEVRKEFGKFDPAKVDNRTYPIFLNIDNTGKVKAMRVDIEQHFYNKKVLKQYLLWLLLKNDQILQNLRM